MTLAYNPDPHTRLPGVHPDLIRVFMRACETYPHHVQVIQGLRTREEMAVNYGKGRTAAQCVAKGVDAKYAQPSLAKVTWLNDPFKSNHRKMADGYGHAIDVAMLKPDGAIDWNDTHAYAAFQAAMMAAAGDLSVGVRCLAPKDPGHFELTA